MKPHYVPGKIEVLVSLPLPSGHLVGLTVSLLQKLIDTIPDFKEPGNPKPKTQSKMYKP